CPDRLVLSVGLDHIVGRRIGLFATLCGPGDVPYDTGHRRWRRCPPTRTDAFRAPGFQTRSRLRIPDIHPWRAGDIYETPACVGFVLPEPDRHRPEGSEHSVVVGRCLWNELENIPMLDHLAAVIDPEDVDSGIILVPR